jgi:hypothetical protein
LLPLLRKTKFASTRGGETGLTAGAAAGSSIFREDGTSFDDLVGETSSTGAPQTPGDDDASNEEVNDEEPPINEVTIIIALKG